MIVCIFGRVQGRWALNGRLAHAQVGARLAALRAKLDAAAAPAVRPTMLDLVLEQPEGADRARSHYMHHFVPPLIRFIADLLTCSVPLYLKRQCDRTLGADAEPDTDTLEVAVLGGSGSGDGGPQVLYILNIWLARTFIDSLLVCP